MSDGDSVLERRSDPPLELGEAWLGADGIELGIDAGHGDQRRGFFQVE